MVPATTASPAAASAGTGSPVIMLRSTADAPDRTSPSAAIFSPGRTTNTSPRSSRSTGTRRSVPSAPSTQTSRAARRRQLAHGLPRRATGAGLVEPPGEQERGDRRGDLEVDAAARGVRQLGEDAHPGRAVQVEHRVHRPPAGGGDPEGNQRVHRGRAVPGVLDGSAVERPRCPQRHRRRQGHQDPLPAGEPVGGKQRKRDRTSR